LRQAKIFAPFIADRAGVVFLEANLLSGMARMIGDAPEIPFASADEILLTKAPLLAKVMHVSRVAAFLRDGRLKPSGRLQDTKALSGVVLRVEDLLNVFRVDRAAPTHPEKYIGFDRLAARLNAARADVRALVVAGVIQPEIWNRLERGRRIPIFNVAQIKAFERDFVSITELDRRLPMTRLSILRTICKHSIAGSGPEDGDRFFFLRQPAERALGLV
jgi:hypothetical protein